MLYEYLDTNDIVTGRIAFLLISYKSVTPLNFIINQVTLLFVISQILVKFWIVTEQNQNI